LSIDFGVSGWPEGASQIVWSAAEIQKFSYSDFPKADTQELSTRGSYRPVTDMDDRKAEFSPVTMELSQELTTKTAPNPARCQQGR
jgi:hypothetical protein